MYFELLLWGSLGLIIGSFVNVLILRQGVSSIMGRSTCLSCKRVLRWFELIPIASWITLSGRCRTCHSIISPQYPIVEILTAASFLVIGLAPVDLMLRVIGVAIAALLIATAVYDLYFTVIPDEWSYTIAALALIYTLFAGITLWTLLAGPLVALPLFLMWRLSRGTWMGLGDAKLVLGIGWLLGLLHGYIVLLLAFIIGAFVGVFILLPLPYFLRTLARAGLINGFVNGGSDDEKTANGAGITAILVGKQFTMKSEVPFGPFLICALCIIWFSELYGYDVASIVVRMLTFT